MSAEPFQIWSHLEEGFCKNHELPAPTGVNEGIFRSIVQDNSARRAEAFALQSKADPLLAIRAHVYRGSLKEAQNLADSLIREISDVIREGELLLELARVSAMNGNWSECIAVCDRALGLTEIAPVSQLTLFQIRALARFECAQMMLAIEDLDRADSLVALFPNSPSGFYAAALRARIVARDRGVSEGLKRLDSLWQDTLRTSGETLDRLHVLIRTELDLLRLDGVVSPSRLLASYRITEITGERLYQALAAVECAFSGIPEFEARFGPETRDFARAFPRVQRILDEIEGRVPAISVSVATLLSAKGENYAPRVTTPARVTSFLMLRRRQVVILEPFSLVSLTGLPQLEEALRALSQGPTLVSDFFAKVWGNATFAPHLHSTLISSLLYRLKRRTGVQARVSRGGIQLKDVLVIP